MDYTLISRLAQVALMRHSCPSAVTLYPTILEYHPALEKACRSYTIELCLPAEKTDLFLSAAFVHQALTLTPEGKTWNPAATRL